MEQSCLKQDNRQGEIPEKLYKLGTVPLKEFKRLALSCPCPPYTQVPF